MALDRLIPAPIDEKNIVSDWIYEMFDMGSCIVDGVTYVGFIGRVPAFCRTIENTANFMLPRSGLYTQEQMDSAFAQLDERLSVFIEDTNAYDDVVVKPLKGERLWYYTLLFYFKEKEKLDKNLF